MLFILLINFKPVLDLHIAKQSVRKWDGDLGQSKKAVLVWTPNY